MVETCLELVPNDDQVCEVYKGTLKAYYLGSGNEYEVEKFVQSNLGNKQKGNGKQKYQQLYLGTQLDTSALGGESTAADKRDDTNNNNNNNNSNGNFQTSASNRAETPMDPTQQQERKVSVVGGLLVAGFLAVSNTHTT